MFKELFGILKDFVVRVLKSRLFPVTIIFSILFSILVVRLFQLQILEADEHQQDYVQMSLTELSTDAVRGNIYDRNGVVLAYDQMVYSVTLKDIGYYEKHAEKNQMIYELIHLLDDCEEEVILTLPIAMSDDFPRNTYSFTTTSEVRLKQLIRDAYGCTLDDLDRADGKYPSNISADQVVELFKKKYYFSKWIGASETAPQKVSAFDALRIINIRYALSRNVYKKYLSINVATNVSETTMATIKENAMKFKGVDIENDYVRVYPDGEYFAQIIGYTGVGNTEEIDALKETDDSYEYGDTIGRSGIEALMETTLSGKKGSRTVYLDSTGKVLEVLSEEESVAGQDVYLTIDHDLTIASYKLLEQEMATIILTYLVNEDVDETVTAVHGNNISIKKVYYQLFSNSVLSIPRLSDITAKWWEREILKQLDDEMQYILDLTSSVLNSEDKEALDILTDEDKEYMKYIIDFLCNKSNIFDNTLLDTTSEEYLNLLECQGNLRNFIYNEIYNSKAINIDYLTDDEQYYDSSSMYSLISNKLLELLSEDIELNKMIIKNLIYSEKLEPYLICMSLYSQGILEPDEEQLEKLNGADKDECYNFIVQCIGNMKLTPAQLALDPCNGSVIITDVNNADTLACVSYPSYDNNMFSGSVNANYYNMLINNQSKPLFNYATQARSAPGSTYKMLSGIAALEEGVLTHDSLIDCTGIFDLVQPAAKCWIYTDTGVGHGDMNIVSALANSCNTYFYNIGYLLSIEEDGSYNEEKGIEKLNYYAKLLGLGEKSGIELNEYAPQISTEYPVPSAIGQGTNNYTPIQLARYVTTIANRGNLYELTLLDKVTNKEGDVIKDFQKKVNHIDEIQDSTWNSIWQGMYEVTHSGTVSNYYKNSNFDVSGKTGSAQEDLTRPNHAWFVSFGPSDTPEITVTCSIRNGYSSGYAADLANDVYKYYFGYTTLDSIMSTSIIQDNSSIVGD